MLRREFVRENLDGARAPGRKTASGCPVIVGFIDRSEAGRPQRGGAAAQRTVEARYHKVQLPNFGVFDEQRYFVPGTAGARSRSAASPCGLSVCEDAWHDGLPFARLRPGSR